MDALIHGLCHIISPRCIGGDFSRELPTRNLSIRFLRHAYGGTPPESGGTGKMAGARRAQPLLAVRLDAIGIRTAEMWRLQTSRKSGGEPAKTVIHKIKFLPVGNLKENLR